MKKLVILLSICSAIYSADQINVISQTKILVNTNWVTTEVLSGRTNGVRQVGYITTNLVEEITYKGKTRIIPLDIIGKEAFPSQTRTNKESVRGPQNRPH